MRDSKTVALITGSHTLVMCSLEMKVSTHNTQWCSYLQKVGQAKLA